MQGNGGVTAASHHRKPKSREVSPRFLSPASSTASSSTDYGSHESPNSILSPIKQKPRSSTDSRKSKTLKNSGFLRGLWPSSAVLSSKSKKPDTLGDFIGNERREELEERKIKGKSDLNLSILNRQRSCTEFSRFKNDRNISSKENRNPIFGGSMRYTGKFKFPGKSKDSNLLDEDENILPGRFSIDEVAVRKNSFSKRLSEPETQDSGSEYSDGGPIFDFPASYMAPTVSSRKHRIDVPSRYMQDLSSRSRRWSGESSENNSSNNSPNLFNLKKKGSGGWAWSPARTGSPRAPLGENKGKMTAMMNSKPPTSPSRGRGVGNILSLGIELLKGKKSSSSSSAMSPLGPGSVENVHQLRLMHNRLAQWRFSNARAEAANENVVKQAEEKSQHVQTTLIKLQQSVLQKKFQLQKEKLKMKLDYILHSQIKALEAWGNMERQHSSTVSKTTDYLHSAVCKIPLVNGAKVEPRLASVGVVFDASELAAEINTMITTFQPTVETTVGVVAELAMVVIQEKQLLEECLDLFKFISALEIKERSLRSSMMQLRLLS